MTGSAVSWTVNTICQANNVTQAVCGGVSRAAKAAGDVVMKIPGVEKLASSGNSMQTLLQQEFFVPEEDALRHTKNCNTIVKEAAFAVATGGAIVLGNRIIKGFSLVPPPTLEQVGRFFRDESGSVRIPKSSDYFIKRLQEHGYTLVKGGKGSHRKLRRPESRMIIIPQKKELPLPMAKDLIKTIKDLEKQP